MTDREPACEFETENADLGATTREATDIAVELESTAGENGSRDGRGEGGVEDESENEDKDEDEDEVSL